MLSLVQLRFGIVITIGPIPGLENVHSDAVSRRFDVPQGHTLKQFLQPLPHLDLGSVLTPIFTVLALLPPGRPYSPLAAALTALECLTGFASVANMGSL